MARGRSFLWLAGLGAASLGMASLGTVMSHGQAHGQSLPAVSGANAKIDLRANAINGAIGGYSVGSLSLPFGRYFGVQFDGLAGSMSGAFSAAFAGHAFWRNPNVGLIGAYGDYGYDAREGGLKIGHGGGEIELYWGRMTISGLVGYQFGDAQTGLFGKGQLALYLAENFKVYGGYTHLPGIPGRAIAGTELMFGESGFSVFGEGRKGSDQWTAMAGIRFYSGQGTTLLEKQRRDEPQDHFGLFIDAASGYFETPVDSDGDGWYSGSGGDCNDSDPNIYPGNGC